MKILFPVVDRSIRVATHFTQFQKALSKVADVDFVMRKIPEGYKTGNYAKKVLTGQIKPKRILDSYFEKDYDFIVTDSDFVFVHENWKSTKIPKAIIKEDIYSVNSGLQVKWAKENKFDIIFYKYKNPFFKKYRAVENIFRCMWSPHSVDIEMFKDYGLKKKYEVLLVGRRGKNTYPKRNRLHHLLKGKKYFTSINRPLESNVGCEKECLDKWPVKEDYAKLLNQAEICVTSGLSFDYPVMKYFEIPASKCLLMSNWFSELADLGFKDGENMVVIDFKNLDSQIRSLLNNKEELKRIQNNGYELIHKFHTCDIRADTMVRRLEEW